MLVLPPVARKMQFLQVQGEKAWFAVVIVCIHIASYAIYKHRGTTSFKHIVLKEERQNDRQSLVKKLWKYLVKKTGEYVL